MSLSDPSLTPLGTTAVTPKQQAQVREVLMNSSMMYMHEVRRFHQEISHTEVLLFIASVTISRRSV